jgi:hypothetical protein
MREWYVGMVVFGLDLFVCMYFVVPRLSSVSDYTLGFKVTLLSAGARSI